METKIRTRESRAAIERLYITMRHLFIRGSYKPLGVSGEELTKTFITLNPEIYGSMSDPYRVELSAMKYVLDRLPKGIERCRFIRLIAREGFEQSDYEVIVPSKRRRNCYRIDEDSMYIEVTRGRSDIYDILTHLTFLFNESKKIMQNSVDSKGNISNDWTNLKEFIHSDETPDRKQGITYLSNVLGRTYRETKLAVDDFDSRKGEPSLFEIIYWLGQLTIQEHTQNMSREISFSQKLREIIGHHVYGEKWSNHVKKFLVQKEWINRPVHIVSANMHSFLNTLYGHVVEPDIQSLDELAIKTSQAASDKLRNNIEKIALQNGMYILKDSSGANINVQVFDLDKALNVSGSKWLHVNKKGTDDKGLLLVMDYAFGEQAYECIDELLKPVVINGKKTPLNIESISVMGKAGILKGDKGDIIVPDAHVFEGTGDNYPFENSFHAEEFRGNDLNVVEGNMITVLGTSLQNKDVLIHFMNSSWNAVGIEMEGAHYQKAIQAATKVRKSINEKVKVFYAYYASDNPLQTKTTLASGGLGEEGIKPTYLITLKLLEKIMAG